MDSSTSAADPRPAVEVIHDLPFAAQVVGFLGHSHKGDSFLVTECLEGPADVTVLKSQHVLRFSRVAYERFALGVETWGWRNAGPLWKSRFHSP
jgi:hypothetical protein